MSSLNLEKLEILLAEISETSQGHIITRIFVQYRQIIELEYDNYNQLWGCLSEISNIQFEIETDKIAIAKKHLIDDIKAAISIIKN